LPPTTQEVGIIKHKNSSSHPHPNSTEGNTIIPSSPSQSNTASPGGCINYDPSTRKITVSCSSARLTDIDSKLHDVSLLRNLQTVYGF
jgi:hypothetical protein